jgi:hypothetical protein
MHYLQQHNMILNKKHEFKNLKVAYNLVFKILIIQ